jgi:hypothetical protein
MSNQIFNKKYTDRSSSGDAEKGSSSWGLFVAAAGIYAARNSSPPGAWSQGIVRLAALRPTVNVRFKLGPSLT